MSEKYIMELFDRHEEDGEESSFNFTAKADLTGDANDYTITYNEPDPSLAGCVTSLRVTDKKRIEMTRTGSFTTQMILELGRRHICFYKTPFGSLSIGVYTEEISSVMGKEGGRLSFTYTLDFNTGQVSTNSLTVIIKEAKTNVCTGK